MPSRHTNNFPESGRGLGHVIATIFGSTVGYPSDSLASCLSFYVILISINMEMFSAMLIVSIICRSNYSTVCVPNNCISATAVNGIKKSYIPEIRNIARKVVYA